MPHDIVSRMAKPLKAPPAAVTRVIGRLTLEIRQDISPWKHAVFVAVSLSSGLAICVAILAITGVPPVTLAAELSGVLTSESFHAVLIQAAPLILAGLSAGLAFRIGFWNLGLEGQMILGGIFAAAVSINDISPPATQLLLMGVASALGGAIWVMVTAYLKPCRLCFYRNLRYIC